MTQAELSLQLLQLIRLCAWHVRAQSRDKDAQYELLSAINECDELTKDLRRTMNSTV